MGILKIVGIGLLCIAWYAVSLYVFYHCLISQGAWWGCSAILVLCIYFLEQRRERKQSCVADSL